MTGGGGGAGRSLAALAEPLLLGLALGIFHGRLPALLESLFWPKVAQGLLLLALGGAGLGALACALLPARLRGRLPALPAAGAALLAAVAAAPAAGAVAQRLLPGIGLGLGAFPPAFLLLLAAPHAVAGAAIARWGGERPGAVAALALTAGLVLAGSGLLPRAGRGRVAFSGGEGGAALRVRVDRGLREDVIARGAPARLPFAIPAGRDGRTDVLMAGFPNGPVLAALLEDAGARITLFEEDAQLVSAAIARWPELARAAQEGRIALRSDSVRWFLEREGARYDLVVLAENWSFAAHLSRALAGRREHRYTVEALRAFLGHLEPEGLLLVQRAGIGRVVTGLREAYGAADAGFAERLVVLGQGGRLVSQCWFSPAGFTDRGRKRQLLRYARSERARVLYRPGQRRGRSFYRQLATGPKVRGLYFSTPLDLSPARDARPSFDHMERLLLSPSGRALPEELDPGAGAGRFRVVPSGDRPVWIALLLSLGVGGAGIAAGLLRARDGEAGNASRRGALRAVLPSALFLGAAAAPAIEAFAAWAEWLAPSAGLPQGALAAAFCSAGLAWLIPGRPPAAPRQLGAFAALLGAFAAAGYRVAPAVPRLGSAAAAAVLLAGAALGAVAGLALRAACAELERRGPGTAAWTAAAALAAAAAAAPASRLLAVQFGYPTLWALAAVAALAALRRRRFLPTPPAGGPAATGPAAT